MFFKDAIKIPVDYNESRYPFHNGMKGHELHYVDVKFFYNVETQKFSFRFDWDVTEEEHELETSIETDHLSSLLHFIQDHILCCLASEQNCENEYHLFDDRDVGHCEFYYDHNIEFKMMASGIRPLNNANTFEVGHCTYMYMLEPYREW